MAKRKRRRETRGGGHWVEEDAEGEMKEKKAEEKRQGEEKTRNIPPDESIWVKSGGLKEATKEAAKYMA